MPVERILVAPALEVGSVSPREKAAVRVSSAITDAVACCPQWGIAVLLVDGTELLVHDARTARTAGSGGRAIETASEVLAAITHRGQVPRVQVDELGGRAAILLAWVHEQRPNLRIVTVTVPARADTAALAVAASGLAGAFAGVDEPVVVVALGDLDDQDPDASHGSDTAVSDMRQQAFADAVASSDAAAFEALRPASVSEDAGWAPITVALILASGLGIRMRLLAAERVHGTYRVVACGP